MNINETNQQQEAFDAKYTRVQTTGWFTMLKMVIYDAVGMLSRAMSAGEKIAGTFDHLAGTAQNMAANNEDVVKINSNQAKFDALDVFYKSHPEQHPDYEAPEAVEKA